MAEPRGLRERKKRATRHRLGDVAARLFAEHGYDAVSMADVARAADVADQTVYNYFPTKDALVLDRAEEILERTRREVAERRGDQTPADVVRALVHEDIARYRDADQSLARGEFPALCLSSDLLRRSALKFRHDQATAVAGAITDTTPDISPLVAFAHASALVAVIQAITDRIGASVLESADPDAVVGAMYADADAVCFDAAENFRATLARAGATRARS